ncbi:hypothetical protein DNAM5_188 [Bacillus phage Vinny]|uniref:SsDNA binding domain protein n=1 Tax=Bacillus phage Vinny TaxID=1805955 RepID=A0A143FJW1_9CAUD|nr:hypothetical protein DNAM5_188 [Bacillus phage Vinny]
MNFAEIIEQQRKELESQGGSDNPRVVYPASKHKRLFFNKDVKEVFVQILPSADLVSGFAVHNRKIFLSATTSKGKKINSNFTLDGHPNEGSLLENKIAEWSEKGMIPTGFGGQQKPKQYYTANVVQVFEDQQGNFFHERDPQGNLIVRLFDIPHSAYKTIINAFGDKRLARQRELSFIDPNQGSPVLIKKPAKGQMEYPVTIYQDFLPPLGQGWETQLEDLHAHCVPTERLENGYLWVETFVNILEGKTSNGNAAPAAPQTQAVGNPYAAQGQLQVPNQGNPFVQQQPQTQQPVYSQNLHNVPPYQQQQQQQPVINMPTGMTQQQPQYQQPVNQQQVAPLTTGAYVAPMTTGQVPAQPTYQAPQQPVNQVPAQQSVPVNQTPQFEPDPLDFNIENNLEVNGGVIATEPDLTALPINSNGLADINSLIDQELGI